MKERILKKLGIKPATNSSFKILIATLKTILKYSNENELRSLKTWEIPLLSNLRKLNSDEIKFIESEIPKVNISIEDCQIEVQKLIPQEIRKKFAVYYTTQIGTQFMASITQEYIKQLKKEKVVLADPFLGSGRTLTTTIKKIGVKKIKKVWGIEPLYLPAIVAYASILDATKGKKDIIEIIAGDAFKVIPNLFSPIIEPELPKADIILTNPPFTRWMYLEKSYRDYLLTLITKLGYSKYITRKEVSLQTLSMFLSDYVLNSNGLIVSVLPASTFYTIYGRGFKSFLRDKYELLAMVDCKSRASFSEDSGFKEVIMAAIKRVNKDKPTVFIELNNNNVEEIAKMIIDYNKWQSSKVINLFNIHKLPRFLDINWLSLLGENRLRDIIIDIFRQGLKNKTLGYWNEILGKNSIIRGVEMYGPEFFFIPNEHWTILEDNEIVRIQNTKNRTELTIDKAFLVKTLRKPSLYSHKIEVCVDSYMLSIPPIELTELPKDLQTYISWGIRSETARPAINAYGKYWYSHVYKQMTTKKPFGHVFIPDKVDLTFKNRGVFANYSKEKVAASKNFYIIRDSNSTIAKLMVAWFNSTIFISILILLGRKISETWTRFLENDYLELPVINPNAINYNDLLNVVESIDKILNKELPPLRNQLDTEYRYLLDVSIAKLIGINNPEKTIENIYKILVNNLWCKT